ncbi:forkhead-associated (FHA) domain-containing protein [Striga asiatica]|uniref:Forkhead-associated (FHA) domain-containing protein n=1 Tax=Striga asiatica TaxID=4170 RepID=A0A5A7P1G9_STRAF|nr:forkhead-associated (FHA) domain-containing protein [Striga asiatica]
MGAMVPPYWVPEDDVLLKSAVEAGASLESLAKGAVQFSQRYTVNELQNRWFSLLYDPMVVTEAAPHMLEILRSGFVMQPSLTSGKRRKVERIRKCYYALRKRIFNEPLEIQGPNFDVRPETSPELGPQSLNDLQFGEQAVAHDLSFSYEDNNDLFESKARVEGPFRNFACSSSTMPQIWEQDQEMAGDNFVIPPSCDANVTMETYLAELSDKLFSGDDLLFSDSSVNDDVDMSYYEGFSSLLTFDIPPSRIDSQHLVCCEDPIKDLGPEYKNGVICCMLNTEDPEIPSNEDVFLPISLKIDNVNLEIPKVGLESGELSCRKKIDFLPRVDESWVLDMEEWSENDVPCFSDVEAMILDMDLSPDEPSLYANPEVQQYVHKESKRAIVRLEQAAEACAHRAITTHCAFAVLYGRWSKHFIKKTEVILGRVTEDNKVDIDLGREKNGGRISRRQAIIKMDKLGNFQLTNIGRSLVHVNGNEALRGQSLSLASGCLIEVRGFAFIFETSRMNINQYLNRSLCTSFGKYQDSGEAIL